MSKKCVVLIAVIPAVLAALFLNCVQKSVLSDVDLTDPSVIRADIQMERDIAADGGVSQRVEAYLYDKDANPLELKNGAVYVNGMTMAVEYVALTNLPYYSATSKIAIKADSLYTFSVMLSDSVKYNFTVRTQLQDIHSLTAPLTFNYKDTLAVSWLEKDTTGIMSIIAMETARKDSTYSYPEVVLPVDQPRLGVFVFPPRYFDSTVTSINIALKSVCNGTVNSSFRSGSKITCTMLIERNSKAVGSAFGAAAKRTLGSESQND